MARSKSARGRATPTTTKTRRRRSARLKAMDTAAKLARRADAKARKDAKAKEVISDVEVPVKPKSTTKSVFSHVEIVKKNIPKKEYVCYLGCEGIESTDGSSVDYELVAYMNAAILRGTLFPYGYYKANKAIRRNEEAQDHEHADTNADALAAEVHHHPVFQDYLDESPEEFRARWREWFLSGCEGTTD